jgi:hypothetical protein
MAVGKAANAATILAIANVNGACRRSKPDGEGFLRYYIGLRLKNLARVTAVCARELANRQSSSFWRGVLTRVSMSLTSSIGIGLFCGRRCLAGRRPCRAARQRELREPQIERKQLLNREMQAALTKA